MNRVFIDSDITFDLLIERHPFYDAAARLFSLADNNKLKIYISALSFSNLHYILRKKYNAELSIKTLQRLKAITNVLAVNEKIIDLALSSDFNDLEDAIQYYVALENEIPIILTRNLKDFKLSKIPVMTADDFLKSNPD